MAERTRAALSLPTLAAEAHDARLDGIRHAPDSSRGTAGLVEMFRPGAAAPALGPR